ncbi:Inositol 2-dehydrogenase [Vanrija pseudolonga]|uniref:Inositol 2-dehydrogenase n=1 Tax=Vanrija pseudolonga TaxID=143232 RepID=A0AAF0YEN1_9TREE|nr:Inositol 2-dehydrogenase [Vanrija pseudolonga]
MPSPVLRVAVVGIGEVALNTHLPNLALCSHWFKVVALVDVSEGALAHAGAKFGIERLYTSLAALLDEADDVDLVMVMSANEYHVQHTTAALRAGKHVFVEKPMALSLAGADEIARVQRETGKVVFVGYMRRYAAAYLRVKALVEATGRENINYVRVRDLIGKNEYFVGQSGAFPLKFTDAPAAAVAERAALSDTMVRQAIGDKRAANALDRESWALLTSLSSHDISAMRELIGMPERVVGASRSPDSQFIWVMFQYPGFVAYYEVGIDNVKLFDAHIEVYTTSQRIKVTYDTPYVKGLPITATVLSTKDNGDFSEETLRPTYEDAFTLEYRELYAAIVDGAPVKTGPADSRDDLVIFKMVMDALV